MRDESIKRIMTERPTTVSPEDLLVDVRSLLSAREIHHLPVLENGKLVGILSESDFLKVALIDRQSSVLAKAKVRDIMLSNPVVICSDASLRDAAEKFRSGEFHALPVVDADGELVGIVTTTDIVDRLLRHLPQGDGTLRESTTDARDLSNRTRLLEAACRAAELYIRSGHGEREHSVLVKRLADLRSDDGPSL